MKRDYINTVIKMTIDQTFFQGKLEEYEPRVKEDLTKPKYSLIPEDLRALSLHLNKKFYSLSKSDPDIVSPIIPPLTPEETSDKNTVEKLRKLIEKRVAALVVAVFTFYMACGVDPSEAAIYLEDYNLDNNPAAVSAMERRVFIAHRKFPALIKADINKNGRIEPSELSLLNDYLEEETEAELQDVFSSSKSLRKTEELRTKTISIQEARHALDVEKKPETEEEKEEAELDAKHKQTFIGKNAIYLRNSRHDVSIRKPTVTNDGAQFSLNRDEVTGNTTGEIKAALGIVRRVAIDPAALSDNPYAPFLSAAAFGAGVSIDRSWDPKGRASQRDTLSTFFNTDIEFANALFDLSYLSASTHFDTDTYFDKKIIGAGLAYQPYSAFMRRYYKLGKTHSIVFRVQPNAFTEYNHVLDEGVETFSIDEYINIGFNTGASLDLVNRSQNRLLATLSSSYQGSWNANSSFDYTYKWQNRLSYWLDENSTVSADLTYNLEKDRNTSKDTNILKLGVGVKF